MKNVLDIQHIEVAYGKVLALKGISLQIQEGEFVAVIGSNGAGKTTMMNTIVGLLHPSKGAIYFKGKPINGLAAHQIVDLKIACVPEGRKVFSQLSIKDNLRLGAFTRLRRGEHKQVGEKLEELYQLFPILKQREQQKAGSLSGGEQQMLALARALMSEPELLLLDEPSMGLAPVVMDEVFKLLLAIKKQKISVLLVEQFAYRALAVAEKAYVIEQGNIILSGSSAEILSSPIVKKAYLGNT